MSEQKPTVENLDSLMGMLASRDGMIRQKARKSLVAVGKPAISRLSEALLTAKRDQVRWEAAKALGSIGDEDSIPPLVKALEDHDADVAWVAAEGLRNYEKAAWPHLLSVLAEDGWDSVLLRKGAHHVLSHQEDEELGELLETLLKELESGGVPESARITAREMLHRLGA